MKRDPIYHVIPLNGATSVAKFGDPEAAMEFAEKVVEETGVSHTVFEAAATCVATRANPDTQFESVKSVQENACEGRDCPCYDSGVYGESDQQDEDGPEEPMPKEIASIGGFLMTLRAVKRSRELADELIALAISIEHPAMRATFKKTILSFLTSELKEV